MQFLRRSEKAQPVVACQDRLVIEVVGDTLPFAAAMLLGPVPMIIVLLILLSSSGTAGGVGFALGRLGGVAATAVLVSALTEVITLESGSSRISAILRIVLGVALMAFAVVKLMRRSPTDDDVPKWMSSVEGRSPAGAAGLGFVLTVANPKELAFTVGAGLTIGGAGLPVAQTVMLAAVYSVTACLTVIVPVVAFLVARERMAGPFGRARNWLVANNGTIVAVMFLVIGSLLIGGGIGEL